jgi:hypothetical protein
VYGSILNAGCKFFDKRIGQSTTLTGRQIVKHMSSEVNRIITGNKDHVGNSIIYGDSVTGDTELYLDNNQAITIEKLFDKISYKVIQDGDKEYAVPTEQDEIVKVLGFNGYEDEPVYGNINYVMRHKVNKNMFIIVTELDKKITVTQDHSLIVDRAGFLMDISPNNIKENDLLITVDVKNNLVETQRETIKEIIDLGVTSEFVYDVSISDQDPYFFGNGILVHNTDSVFFTAYPTFKKAIDSGKISWDKDSVVELYNEIAKEVNESFPDFMLTAFNCPVERGSVIKAARELVGTKGLYITKKRYALMYYDKKNSRTDINGKPGKIKAMGLDLKRSDTPDFMQDFLNKILEKVLLGYGEHDITEMVRSFRQEFKHRPGWEKGTPKRVNNITKFKTLEEEHGKANMPGHVRASINWNTLKKIFNDNHSLSIMDGAKTIVCKLKPNALNFTSVAYPIDQLVLPEWFKDLPFDDAEMESTIIDAKIENLIGVLNWDLSKINEKNTINTFFKFS